MENLNENQTYAPLVEYNNKKEFVSLLEVLFAGIDEIASKLTTQEYVSFADICKKLHQAKSEVQTQVVYVEIARQTQRKPPKPQTLDCEKLEDARYRTCEFCDKRLHKKYYNTHLRES